MKTADMESWRSVEPDGGGTAQRMAREADPDTLAAYIRGWGGERVRKAAVAVSRERSRGSRRRDGWAGR